MKGIKGNILFLIMVPLILLIIGFATTSFAQSSNPMLKMVFIDAKSPAEVKKLARMGIDIATVRKGPIAEDFRGIPAQTYRVDAVVSARDVKKLGHEGFNWSDASIRTHAVYGGVYSIFQGFDEIKAQLYNTAAANPHIASLITIGYSIQGRPLLAMCLHKSGKHSEHNCPEVLYIATHHAREWVATLMAMRLIQYLTENYGIDEQVTRLLNTRRIWIIPVANPDGYEYTFTTGRLWRKNLRDNDGDGLITLNDGVDINRNFDSYWGYDNEGSSPNCSDQAYRGAAPNSEPETRALAQFIHSRRHQLTCTITYHSYSNFILYPWGWQTRTLSHDDPVYVALAGTAEKPAIWDNIVGSGYLPGTIGDILYVSNGDYVNWCYNEAGILAFCVELTNGFDGYGNFYGFEFPDDEVMMQTVFEDNLPFALACAESASDLAHPVSPVGIETQPVYHTPITASYGRTQGIEILARTARQPARLYYSINGGHKQWAPFQKKTGAIYNMKPGLYYCRYQALIRGQRAGDEITYRIVKDDVELGPYTYDVVSTTGNPILIVSAEDYSGPYPDYDENTAPNYLHYYTEALDAAGYRYDIWDVDQHDAAPSYIEVLSHYDVAIWYTGDDYVPFDPLPGVLEAEYLNFRDFMNYEGGKLFATGQDLGWLAVFYGQFPDDFFQYYLGSYMHLAGSGMDQDSGLPFDIIGVDRDPIFDGLAFSIHGGNGADNQHDVDSFLLTSHLLPHFTSSIAARYDRIGAPPFDPHSGGYCVYSQKADMAYKRLGGTFTLPAGTATLTFWISYDIESYWDYAFVEICEAGTDTWTTLPEMNGLTTQETGESCAGKWVDQIHPFLAHYMNDECLPQGTTGDWHAFTGNSGGWKQVEFDLTAYAGKCVELYISYATDWATQNLGIFVDDVQISGSPLEDFEAGMGAFSVSTAPGSVPPLNNWILGAGLGIPEGPVIRTPDTVYLGFGFEAIDTAKNRKKVMNRIMHYFGL